MQFINSAARAWAAILYAVKGMAGSRPMWPPKVGKSKKYKGHKVWIVGVDVAKDATYSRLRIGNAGLGYWHFPLSYTRDFFEQLTSERVVTRLSKATWCASCTSLRAKETRLSIAAPTPSLCYIHSTPQPPTPPQPKPPAPEVNPRQPRFRASRR
jgi:hypothetical protein